MFYSRTITFLIYINDLAENLLSSQKLFADDTSLLSIVLNIARSSEALNYDLSKWKTGEFSGKWFLTQALLNKSRKRHSLTKKQKENYPPVVFNNNNLSHLHPKNIKHFFQVMDVTSMKI